MRNFLALTLAVLSVALILPAYYYDSGLLRAISIVGIGATAYPLYALLDSKLAFGRGWVRTSTLITQGGVVLSCLIYLSLLWMDGKL